MGAFLGFVKCDETAGKFVLCSNREERAHARTVLTRFAAVFVNTFKALGFSTNEPMHAML